MHPLTQYIVALHFFSRVLYRSPDEALVRSIYENRLFGSFHGWKCFHDETGEGAAAISALEAHCSAGQAELGKSGGAGAAVDYRAVYLDMHQDHLRLFSGPFPAAPPWESVWRERQRLLFGETTAAVRAIYAAHGLAAERANREPEDHLGLELAFLAHLIQQGLAENAERNNAVETSREAAVRFLDEHVLVWAEDCLVTAANAAATLFYRQIPPLCLRLLVNLRRACQTPRSFVPCSQSN